MAGHHVSSMASIWLSLIVLFTYFGLSNAQKSNPKFIDISAIKNRYLPESIPIGYYLGRIVAVDPDGTSIKYFISGSGGEYFNLDQSTGNITLKKLLDYENAQNREIKSLLTAQDKELQEAKIDCTSYVDDVNDNAPVFKDTAIYRLIPEDAAVSTIIADISVSDVDIANSLIDVTCDTSTAEFAEACQTFALRVTERTNQYWRGQLILQKALDYEIRLSYNVRLIAKDGDPSHTVTNEVHIEVQDVNDSPPIISNVGPKSIDEEHQIGAPILQVTAVDGDTLNKRSINYEICNNLTNLFQINKTSGVLTNIARLDYDDGSHEKGVPYDICIKVREVINATTGQLGDSPITTATTTLKVTIQDINDNGPVFSNKTYYASVYENTVSGANIPGLQMTVTDKDSEPLNSFNLAISNYLDVFGIIPTKDTATSSVTLFVKNGTKLDYEKGVRLFVIEVLATQNFQNPLMYTSTATVSISVIDVNDFTPTFDQPMYNATVVETAPASTTVISIRAHDPEEGDYGAAGIRYKLYGDNVPPNFSINELTGDVTVAPCATPGLAPCIDYERKTYYNLIVSATDNKGVNGRTQSVQLYINVLDVNDNKPKIDSKYVEYIYEDKTETINPLYIVPTDPDGLPLTFTINGDASALWRIDVKTDAAGGQYGAITAVRPIKDADARYPRGQFNFVVGVADANFYTEANVTIFVIDINNNAPYFLSTPYDKYINESTKGGFSVMSVTARDEDNPSTGNGVIDFYLHSAEGLFTVTNARQDGTVFVADIVTTSGASFTYEKKNEYYMIVVAQDRGSPNSLSGQAQVVIRLNDVNDKDPTIEPPFQSIAIYENEPVNKIVYTVTANDPDVDKKLNFSMTAISATDGTGDNVNITQYDYTKLFGIMPLTGEVYVNSALDRDKTSRITFLVGVEDLNGKPLPQSGTGTFLIHILEYNSRPPYFDAPFYNITIDEAMNVNSFVLNLNCQDDDDKISGYTLKQDNPPVVPPKTPFFELLAGSGAMIISSPIDYEQVKLIELTAQCTDDGQPILSSTVKVVVNIRNINDNAPVFNQTSYSVSKLENTGGFLVQTYATDADSNDDGNEYGVVKYRLDDPYGFFEIDNNTGRISVIPNFLLDREKNPYIAFQVIAYDSQKDPSVRKSSAVPVYVTLLDDNDNCPMFTNTSYTVRVPENVRVGSIIIETTAKDADIGLNALLMFSIKSGSFNPPATEQLFGISKSGDLCRIVVLTNLKGLIGTYNLNITVTDMNGTDPSRQCTTERSVKIEVIKSENNAPIWINPPTRDFVINVLESQYDGMLVYNSRAVDPDPGPNGRIDYYFSTTGDTLVSSTPEFKINIVTGVISAVIVFDREQQDTYFLTLVAMDNGTPRVSSQITVIVVILDVNDNDPAFPMKDGVVTPKELSPISENITIASGGRHYLDKCEATDADTNTTNNRIYYELVPTTFSRISEYIYVENTTCNIYLIKNVDYESTPKLEFEIRAYNLKNDDSVLRSKRETRPNFLPVILRVVNSNDNPPTFVQREYLACVSVNAPYQQNIVQVTATDKDVNDNSLIAYYLSDTRAFQINKNLGIIYNTVTFSQYNVGQTMYSFNAIASDGVNNATANVIVFVTSPAITARLKVNRPLSDVVPLKQQFVQALQNSQNGAIAFACIDDVKNYVDDSGVESKTTSNVFVSAFKYRNGQYMPYSASELSTFINKESKTDSELSSIYISNAEEDTVATDSSILKEDAVLAIFIICILLIFLALLLICIACICVRQSDKRKEKRLLQASYANPHIQEEFESSDNPVYNIKGSEFPDDGEYSTIKKVKPYTSELSPVVVPTSYVTTFVDDVPPVEPPRAYLNEPDEPFIETFIDPEPVTRTYTEPEPVIETFIDPEPVFKTYIEPDPVIETYIEPEPVIESYIEPESEVLHHMSFPEPVEEDEVETSIRDSSPRSSSSRHRGSPPPSPPSSFRHESSDSDSD